jgi:hypothetical protein
MKKYTVKPNEDLGSIAHKFGLPSWKYLYQLNKDAIGDNPDLLEEGTVLKMPVWNSTSGDEKIEEKGADPFQYTGGLRYRYPWAPFSMSLVGEDGTTLLPDFEEPVPVVIRLRSNGAVVYEGELTSPDQLERLLPDAPVKIGIKGTPLYINGEAHLHPDDEVSEGE